MAMAKFHTEMMVCWIKMIVEKRGRVLHMDISETLICGMSKRQELMMTSRFLTRATGTMKLLFTKIHSKCEGTGTENNPDIFKTDRVGQVFRCGEYS